MSHNKQPRELKFNDTFNSEKHAIELADGTKQNVALKQGTYKIQLKDSEGINREGELENTLYNTYLLLHRKFFL